MFVRSFAKEHKTIVEITETVYILTGRVLLKIQWLI